MNIKFTIAKIAVAIAAIITVPVVSMAAVTSPNYWKLVGGYLTPVSSWTIGSSTINGSFNNLTVKGAITISGGGTCFSPNIWCGGASSTLSNSYAFWQPSIATPSLTLTTARNVGVNNASPAYTLDVGGSI